MSAAYRSPWLFGAMPPFARVGQIGTPTRCRPGVSCVLRRDPSILAAAVTYQGRPFVVTGSRNVRVHVVLPNGWANVSVDVPDGSYGGFIRAAELMTLTGGAIAVPPAPGEPTTRFPTEREGPPIPEPPPPPPPATDEELTQTNETEPEPEPAKTPTGLERAAEVAVLLSPLWGAFLLSLAFPPPGAR